MAEFTRATPDIGFTNFINPGVVDKSTATAIEGLGNAAIQLDTALAKKRFAEDLENLETARLAGFKAGVAAQEENASTLSSEDQSAVDEVAAQLGKRQAAAKQGIISDMRYRVEGERLLRMAMAKRPGLAQEFRQMAATFLGTDVVGASRDALLALDEQYDNEQTAAKKAEAKAKEDEFNRAYELAKEVGMGHLIASAARGGDLDAGLKLFYSEDFQKEVAAYMELKSQTTALELKNRGKQAGQQYTQDTRDADFVVTSQGKLAEFIPKIKDTIGKLLEMPPQTRIDTIKQILTGASFDPGDGQPVNFLQYIKNQRDMLTANARANGVSEQTIKEQRESWDYIIGNIERLTDPNYDAGQLEGDLKRIVATSSINLVRDSAMLRQVAAIDRMVPNAGANLLDRNGVYGNQLAAELGRVMGRNNAPEDTVRYAGGIVSNLSRTMFIDNKAAPLPPGNADQTTNALVVMLEAFVSTPEFRMDYFSKPNAGVMSVIGQQGYGAMYRQVLGDENADRLSQAAAKAAFRAISVAATQLRRDHPELAGKLTATKPGKGREIITINGEVSDAARQAVEAMNRKLGAGYIYNFFRGIGGMKDDASVLNYINRYGQVKPQDVPKNGTASAKPSTTGSHWWENLYDD